jgi:hypothetical protein
MHLRAILTPEAVALSCGLLLLLLFLLLLFYVVASGFRLKRIGLAMRCEWRILRDPAFAEKMEALLAQNPHAE